MTLDTGEQPGGYRVLSDQPKRQAVVVHGQSAFSLAELEARADTIAAQLKDCLLYTSDAADE